MEYRWAQSDLIVDCARCSSNTFHVPHVDRINRTSSTGGTVAKKQQTYKSEFSHARRKWGQMPEVGRFALYKLVSTYGLSVLAGDLIYLSGSWYATHSGLLRLACRK